MPRVSDVFVAGGQPRATYVSREGLRLEDQIRQYLDTRFKVLSVSGPTKTGKTVLLRSVIPRDAGIWVSGGQVHSPDELWEHILEQTGGFTDTVDGREETTGDERGRELDASAKVAGLGGGAKSQFKRSKGESVITERGRRVSPRIAALASLEESQRPLVIDDFHYIDPDVQLQVIRSLKDPVFNGVPVILLSVPHRAFDAVRVEREMTGRVDQLEVTFWDEAELRAIASKGFRVLNVVSSPGIVERLASEAFSSPHLMQDFCGDVCRRNGIIETVNDAQRIESPTDWDEFFRSKAAGASKAAFDRLAVGPRQRTDRMQRKLKNGVACDIYVAVLLAIAKTGPLTEIRYEELRAALREILEEAVPQAHEITRVLEQMSKIAREEIEGEPVVDWDRDLSTLHIADPFFAYFLRWGTELP